MAFSAGSQFPPGFRFHPSDQELIIHYLRNKITSSNAIITSIIADVDIYKFNPWDLPDKAFFGEGEWFFFSPRDRKYPNGARPNRAAASGYWKATGTDKPILATGGSQCLGVKKALVFYKGRPPKGIKTDWVMHEYRLLDANPSLPQNQKGSSTMRLDDIVLCRVRQKGSTPTQSEEGPAESSGLTHPAITQNIEKRELGRGNNNLYGPGDYQLLADILVSQDDGGESGCENSNLLEFTDSSSSSSVVNNNIMAFNGCVVANRLQKPHPVDAVKPTFSSLEAMDGLMFQMPNKRLRFYNGGENDQLSPPLSFYVDQTFPKFF